ncbi:calcium-binding protein, partial [Palleronia caenipelagi]
MIGYGGHDTLYGGAGNDQLWGSDGNDLLNGGIGADTILGGNGNDTLVMDSFGDRLSGGAGIDVVQTFVGINLTDGVQALDTSIENVALLGSGNIDAIGNHLDNVLSGNVGSNVLSGYSGHDRLNGNAGNDRLFGGAGNDLLNGGIGSDTFVFALNYDRDTVVDFEDNIDTLRLAKLGVNNFSEVQTYATQVNGDVMFDFGSGDTLTIRNITLNALADDMIFV